MQGFFSHTRRTVSFFLKKMHRQAFSQKDAPTSHFCFSCHGLGATLNKKKKKDDHPNAKVTRVARGDLALKRSAAARPHQRSNDCLLFFVLVCEGVPERAVVSC